MDSAESGIVHDLNNCLHVLRNSIELLSRSLDPVDGEARTQLEMARRNVERAAALTRRLLEEYPPKG